MKNLFSRDGLVPTDKEEYSEVITSDPIVVNDINN